MTTTERTQIINALAKYYADNVDYKTMLHVFHEAQLTALQLTDEEDLQEQYTIMLENTDVQQS